MKPTTYKIATLQDIWNLPDVKTMKRCLREISNYMPQQRMQVDAQSAMLVELGIPCPEGAFKPTFPIEWVDDGKRDATTVYECEGKEVLRIEPKGGEQT